MTTSRQIRCAHCGQRYVFQASGNGCERATNDHRWCPQCMGIALAALKGAPRLLTPKWCTVRQATAIKALIEEPTLDDCVRWRAARQEMARRSGDIFGYAERIWPALTNVMTGESQSIWGVCATDGVYRDFPFVFRVSHWPYGGGETVIEVQLEVDVLSNRLTGSLW